MANRPVNRSVKYTKGKSVKKTEPYYGPYFANSSAGEKESKRTIKAHNTKSRNPDNWKVTPKWKRATVPLKPVYTSKKKKK